MMWFEVISSVLVCLTLAPRFRGAEALSSGAPSLACASMTPQHFLFNPQPLKSCPFTVRQSKLTYNSKNDSITVTLTVKADHPHRTFRGFLVKAMNPLNQHSIGQFQQDENVNIRSMCHGATHVDARDKSKVVLHWIPKNVEEEDNLVVFEATFVEAFRKFYVGVQSTFKGRPAAEASADATGSLVDKGNTGMKRAQHSIGNEIDKENEKKKTRNGPNDLMNSFWF